MNVKIRNKFIEIKYSISKAWVYAKHCRDILWSIKALSILTGEGAITLAGLSMETKAPQFYCTAGMVLIRSEHGM